MASPARERRGDHAPDRDDSRGPPPTTRPAATPARPGEQPPVAGAARRILVVTPDFPPHIVGGGAIVVQRLVEEYVRSGAYVRVIALDTRRPGWWARPRCEGRGDYEVAFLPVMMRVVRGGIDYSNGIPPSWPSLRWLARTFAEGSWDAVHLHGVPVLLVDLAALHARKAGRPYVLTVHGLVRDPSRYGPVLRWVYGSWLRVERWLYRSARAITGVSETTVAEIRSDRFRAPRILTIPNAPIEPKPPLPAELVERTLRRLGLVDRRFGFSLGNFISRKGHLTLVRAIDRLDRERRLPPDFRFVVAGRDLGTGYLGELQREIRSRSLDGRVDLIVDAGDEMIDVLTRRCAIFLCTSLYEAGPLVPLEALARGAALVASDLPPIREVVTEGVDARLFPAGDPDALAQLLHEMVASPESLDRLRAAALDRSGRLPNWTAIARRYLELLGA